MEHEVAAQLSPRARAGGLVAVLLVIVLAGGVAVAGYTARTTATSVRVGPTIFANPPAVIDANNSPAIERNPSRPDNLVVGHRIDRPRFSAQILWTGDGGTTWQPTVLPLPPEDDRPYAPDLAFGPDGTLYVLYVNLQGTGNDPENLWLATSNDGGRTLSPPTRVGGPLTFQARIAIDKDGVLHATWMEVEEVGTLSVLGPTRIVTVRSDDGGATFSEPSPISDPKRERVGAAEPVIDSAGDLVVVYQDFKGDRRDFENLEGPAWDEPFALVQTRSTDGGRSFSEGVELESGLIPTRRFLVYLPELPPVAPGPEGELYVAWTDGRHGDEDVFLRRSDDGGRTWGEAVRVNTNPRGDGSTQHLPSVSVSDDGRVDLVFLDRRRDPDDVLTDAYLASSFDGGKSFDNVRLTSASFDSRVGPMTAPHLGVDLGSRLGISSSAREAVAVWTDTRLGSEDTGRQDIASSVVSFVDTSERRPNSLLLALAAALGLLALGVGVILVRRSTAT